MEQNFSIYLHAFYRKQSIENQLNQEDGKERAVLGTAEWYIGQ